MDVLTVRDIEVGNKRVLLRVDFNVPLDDKTGAITDEGRIRAVIPTIRYLIAHGARVIVISHLGRPNGKVVETLRLSRVAQRLSQILGQEVGSTLDCVGPEVEEAVAHLQNGQVLLLENLRFHAEEEKNDSAFAQSLAKLADIYVNGAFSVSHRAHASVVGVTRYLPSVAGFLLEREVKTLGGLLENPARPFAVLTGGAKISDKIGLLENTMDKIDLLLVGGGMAATFLKAESFEVGRSLVEADRLDTVLKLIAMAAKNGVRLLLPTDVIVTEEINVQAKGKLVSIKDISPEQRIVDIGPQTIANFSKELRRCKTIFWNGPMGVYEIPQFAKGTQAMAELLATLEATTIVGGGSTTEVLTDLGLAEKMSFVSTGGGASLEFLGGEKLPGIEVLPGKVSPARGS